MDKSWCINTPTLLVLSWWNSGVCSAGFGGSLPRFLTTPTLQPRDRVWLPTAVNCSLRHPILPLFPSCLPFLLPECDSYPKQLAVRSLLWPDSGGPSMSQRSCLLWSLPLEPLEPTSCSQTPWLFFTFPKHSGLLCMCCPVGPRPDSSLLRLQLRYHHFKRPSLTS